MSHLWFFLLIVAKISSVKSLIKSLVAGLFLRSFITGATGMKFSLNQSIFLATHWLRQNGVDVCPFRWVSVGQADNILVPGKPSHTQHSALMIAAKAFFKLVRSTAHFMKTTVRRAGAITLPQNVGEGESGTVHLLICHIWGKGRFVMAMTRWREVEDSKVAHPFPVPKRDGMPCIAQSGPASPDHRLKCLCAVSRLFKASFTAQFGHSWYAR